MSSTDPACNRDAGGTPRAWSAIRSGATHQAQRRCTVCKSHRRQHRHRRLFIHTAVTVGPSSQRRQKTHDVCKAARQYLLKTRLDWLRACQVLLRSRWWLSHAVPITIGTPVDQQVKGRRAQTQHSPFTPRGIERFQHRGRKPFCLDVLQCLSLTAWRLRRSASRSLMATGATCQPGGSPTLGETFQATRRCRQ